VTFILVCVLLQVILGLDDIYWFLSGCGNGGGLLGFLVDLL
jgi:hypothetical protein